MSTRHDVKVLDLYLDSQNPRHQPIKDQPNIIERLIKKEQVKNLAKDIALHGISPIEQFAVLKDKSGNFIVLEGNRRLCALMLLNDPERAPDGDKKYFRNLINEPHNAPTTVSCVEFIDREEADIWIERRHEGEQDGRGTRQWNAEQKTRHNTIRGKTDQNALAQAVLDYAKNKGFTSSTLNNQLLTTASRYLGNPTFRNTLGIISGRSDPEVEINVSYSDFEKVISKFINDLMDPESGVNSRTKKKDWEEYSRKLINDGVAPVQRLSTRQKLSAESTNNDNAEDNNQSTDEKDRTRNNKNPDQRPHIVPSSFKVKIKNSILKRVFDELREINVNDHALAASFLCRAFLENLYDLYHMKVLNKHLPEKAHMVMLDIQQQIEADIKAKNITLNKLENSAFGFFKRLPSSDTAELSPKNLGAKAHANHYPDSRQLKRDWDSVEAFISYMLRCI